MRGASPVELREAVAFFAGEWVRSSTPGEGEAESAAARREEWGLIEGDGERVMDFVNFSKFKLSN